MSKTAADVLAACQKRWEQFKSDCSGFVRAVAADVGVVLDGNADTITATVLGGGSWTRLPDGPAAAAKAQTDCLVIGALAGSEHDPPRTHGHAVIVVAGELAHDKYPHAFWGQLGGVGCKNQSINFAWREGDRDRVHFAFARL